MIVAIEIEDGGPAFPTRDNDNGYYGMSLRDYFAAKAMQGMLANPKLQEQILKAGQSWIEESAWAVADAMIDVRSNKNKLLACSVEDLYLTRRALNCLRAEGIETLGDLCNKHTYELKRVPNLGKVCLKEIIEMLAVHGLKLKS